MLATVAPGSLTRAAGPGIPCDEAAVRRAAAARASVAAGRGLGAALPPDTSAFVLFGWVSPPADSTTEARIAEMAGIGLNLALPAWLDEGCPSDNHARLDWAAAYGMRCLIWDSRLISGWQALPTMEDSLDQVVAEYRDHPGLWGYYLGDEPRPEQWPLLARLRAELRERDPTHPAWNNLSGEVIYPDREAFEAALRGYADAFSPAVLSVDHYDFRTWGDYGLFVENLAATREVARERGIPFWNIIQLVPHTNHRVLGHGELRWQVGLSLAMGASGIGYFTYWTPAPDPAADWQPAIIDHDGRRTPWYDFLAAFDVGVRAAGERLVRARWRRTTFAGSVPRGGEAFTPGAWLHGVEGRAAIGEFEGAGGERLVAVVNLDSLAAREVTLRTTDAPGARLVAGGSTPAMTIEPLVAGARISLLLQAGDFAVLELPPASGPPGVAVTPNPGAGRVALAVGASARGARLEILDAGGRRIWSRPLGDGGVVEWSGERDDGRRATPGVYFARVAGAGDAAARRFVWLGPR